MKTILTNSPEETIEVGARLARHLEDGDFIALEGNLGTGKTVFVKGMAKGLGVEDYLYVNSPSFVIVREYHGKKDLYHFDIYRLEEKDFCDTVDYERYFYNKGVTVVEWADKIKGLFPDEYLEIRIDHDGLTKRNFEFKANGQRFQEILEKL
ncbi:MAG: tRNA (adenosine(37)-N6)-threonylcarbamoyltransferase complex ATPase subunit type 1 TsaE [Candidatus Omnitrophota bacterium]